MRVAADESTPAVRGTVNVQMFRKIRESKIIFVQEAVIPFPDVFQEDSRKRRQPSESACHLRSGRQALAPAQDVIRDSRTTIKMSALERTQSSSSSTFNHVAYRSIFCFRPFLFQNQPLRNWEVL
ncbi:unnamed protein product [Amoebophrya sp. A25]|nr:unnamed protein product [Amoebophrya sp. A25]|eukprot:GSA25T00007124001.1